MVNLLSIESITQEPHDFSRVERQKAAADKAQDAILVSNRKDADIVLSIEKSQDPDAICLIDSNFFLPN